MKQAHVLASHLGEQLGSTINSVAVSDERDAHFVAIAPNDPAFSDELFGNDHQRQVLRCFCCFCIQKSTIVGKIANGTSRAETFCLNYPVLKDAASWGPPVVIHRMPPRFGSRSIPSKFYECPNWGVYAKREAAASHLRETRGTRWCEAPTFLGLLVCGHAMSLQVGNCALRRLP